MDPRRKRDKCIVVEVTGGEWPKGRTNTLKVSNPRGTVPTEGQRPWGWGVLAEGEQPQGRLIAEPRGKLLGDGEQPQGGCLPRASTPAH